MDQPISIPRTSIFAFMVIAMSACGRSDTPAPPPTKARDLAAMNTYLNTLPPGELPTPRKEEKLGSVLGTQTDGTGPKACAVEQRRITESFEDIAIFTAASSNIVPGVAIQGKTVLDGTIQALPLSRGPMTYVIDLPISNAQVDVNEVSIADAQQALATLQLRAASIDAPSRLFYSAQIVSSFEHAAHSLGVGARYSGPLVSAGFNASFGDSKSLLQRTIVAKLTQPMYTVSVADDKIGSAANFFAERVTVDDFKALEAQGLIGPANLPTFIKSVTYGRVVYYSITTEDAQSNQELSAAVNASYVGLEGNLDAKSAYQRILSRGTVKALALGGSQDDALTAIRSGNFSLFFKPVKVTQAIPLAYKLTYMHRDRAVVAIKSGLDYTVRDCTACSLTKVLENRVVFTNHYDKAGGLFGLTFDDLFGGACTPGWTRYQVTRPLFSGGGTCDGGFATAEPASCSVHVHIGLPAFQGQICDLWAYEQREVPGQPPLCPR